MAELAARHGQDAQNSGLQPQAGTAAGEPSAERRGSADSFRQLLAKLKKTSDSVQSELAVITPAEAPPPAAVAPPAPIVIAPNPALLPPVAAEAPMAERPQYVEPPPPPPMTVDSKELERRARMRAEAHAASQEIIARLRKAAGQPAEKPVAEPVIETAAEVPPVAEAEGAPQQAQAEILPEIIAELPVDEPQPVAEAQPAAVQQAPQREAGKQRRRHPFFPDVFLDDDGEPVQEPVAQAVAPEPLPQAFDIAEAPLAEAAGPEAEMAPAVAYEPPLPEPQPEPEPVAFVEIAPPEPIEEPVQEAEAAIAEAPAVTEYAPPVAEPPAAVEVQAQPETGTAETEDSGGHQEDLIEDEADAVRHLRGVEVKGIGDIAKAIFSAPTSVERTKFLAEVAALGQQDAEPGLRTEVMAADAATLSTPALTVRKISPSDDPFARIAPDPSAHVNHDEPDDDSGELARSLLDMMLSNPSAGLPQERALAADALLKLIPKVPTKALVTIAERLAIMEAPPNLLIARLINDPRIEISGPLLEQCNHISDQVLGKVVASGQVSLQRLIARRRHLSAALTDQLIEFDDASVILTLVRNSGATISHNSFNRLVDLAAHHSETLAPLATRSDLPAPVAFELFWLVPAELRRYLLSRFLTDSETLTKILKITKVMQGGEGEANGFANTEDAEAFMAALTEGRRGDAEEKLATIAGISADCARRIVGDRQGEPLAIIFKAIGFTRAQFEDYIVKLQKPEVGIINPERVVLELQSTFNSMSFNKARILLTYWDWAVQKHGPYAASQ